MGLEFWDDLEVERVSLVGQVVVRNGYRYTWARNERGHLYLKSLGQVGLHLCKPITVKEYQAQAQAMAEAHEASLSPSILRMIGPTMMLAQMEMAPAPLPIDRNARDGSAMFL